MDLSCASYRLMCQNQSLRESSKRQVETRFPQVVKVTGQAAYASWQALERLTALPDESVRRRRVIQAIHMAASWS